MNRIYIFLLLLILSSTSFAQINNFQITDTAFAGQKIKLFAESRGGAVVVLNDNSLFLMNKQQEFTNVSSLFDTDVLQDISCVEAVNERLFFLGTKNHSLFMYQEGEVLSLKDINPDLPLEINSIDFDGTAFDEQVFIGTSDHVWISKNLKNYTKDDVFYTDTTRFFSGRSAAVLSDFNSNCRDIEGDYWVQYSPTRNFKYYYKMSENDGFTIDGLHDINLVNMFGSVGNNYHVFAYYATENGIYIQRIYFCNSAYTYDHFTNTAVHDLEFISSGLEASAMFAASDSGLLYQEAGSLLEPEYLRLEGIDTAYTVNYSTYHNTIWVGTDDGLIQISDDRLSSELSFPEVSEPDTIDFCRNEGATVYLHINQELDYQWYHNGVKIDSVLSDDFTVYEEGMYSVEFIHNGELFQYDVALLRLDSVFNERIVEQEYSLCTDTDEVYLEIENFDYNNHLYEWYSVERGLEFETSGEQNYFSTSEAGNYYFIASNCNDYSFQSDTVAVYRSQLADPYFTTELNGQDICERDTIYLDGIENVINFTWKVNHNVIEDYNEPYFVVKSDHAYDDISVTLSDQYGCERNVRGEIGYVNDAPFLSPDKEEIYICKEEDYVYFDLDYGVTASWAGFSQGEYRKVSPGTYPVVISNGQCPDYQVDVEVKYYDPLPVLNFQDTVMQVDDTFKIPINGQTGINWEGEIQISNDRSYLYLTSDIEAILAAEIMLSSAACRQSYSFAVRFEGPSILGLNAATGVYNIYPNPAQHGVNIEQPKSGILCLELLNLNGTLVNTQFSHQQNTIFYEFPKDISAGAYLLRITDNEHQIVTKKIIIEK